MRKFFVVLAAMLALGAQTAQAESFDLHCLPDSDADGKRPAPAMHLQVDLESSRWCEDRCRTISAIVRTDPDKLVLQEDVDQFGNSERIAFDTITGLLHHSFVRGISWQGNLQYVCNRETFGGFEPWLGREASLRNVITIMEVTFKGPRPKGATGRNLVGDVRFAVDVDPTGLPRVCKIVESSGYPELDTHTCEIIMMHGKFEFARNRKGEPIAGRYESKVLWR